MFERSKYITQTEITKEYRIGIKAFKQLILDHQIEVVNKDVDLGEYAVVASYFNKEDMLQLLDKAAIPKR